MVSLAVAPACPQSWASAAEFLGHWQRPWPSAAAAAPVLVAPLASPCFLASSASPAAAAAAVELVAAAWVLSDEVVAAAGTAAV